MTQEFEVVRCFTCQIFQIHQTRKDKKFSCKICGIKQSRKKVYCKGTAKDCRTAVQQLNSSIQNEETFLNDIIQSDQDLYSDASQDPKNEEPCIIKPTSSKWNTFLESSENCPAIGTGDKVSKRLEASTQLMEDSFDTNIPSVAQNSFTAVKRYLDSTPKQIIPKMRDVPKWDFASSSKSTLNEKKRHQNSHDFTSKHLHLEFEDATTIGPFLPDKDRSMVQNSLGNPNIPVKSRDTQKPEPEMDENFKQNSTLKNEAFKKFSKLDEDILDLNKSFYS